MGEIGQGGSIVRGEIPDSELGQIEVPMTPTRSRLLKAIIEEMAAEARAADEDEADL